MDVYIYLLTVLFIAGLATIVRFFGGEGLIAGYNTASAEEKAYMKEKGIVTVFFSSRTIKTTELGI
jgi:flagellar basal body-associated protein FliL